MRTTDGSDAATRGRKLTTQVKHVSSNQRGAGVLLFTSTSCTRPSAQAFLFFLTESDSCCLDGT